MDIYQAAAGMGMASGPGFAIDDGVLGATGYTGLRTPAWLRSHPDSGPRRSGPFDSRRWCPPGSEFDPVGRRCYPVSMHGLGMDSGPGFAISEGIFNPYGALGAEASTNFFNLTSPAGLRQFKMALRALDPNLPASALNEDLWDEATEKSFERYIATLTNPSVLGAKVDGHTVPTKTGALAIAGAADAAAKGAGTWPDLTAWAKGFDPQLVPPNKFSGMSTATMVMIGAGVVVGGYVFYKLVTSGGKRRRS